MKMIFILILMLCEPAFSQWKHSMKNYVEFKGTSKEASAFYNPKKTKLSVQYFLKKSWSNADLVLNFGSRKSLTDRKFTLLSPSTYDQFDLNQFYIKTNHSLSSNRHLSFLAGRFKHQFFSPHFFSLSWDGDFYPYGLSLVYDFETTKESFFKVDYKATMQLSYIKPYLSIVRDEEASYGYLGRIYSPKEKEVSFFHTQYKGDWLLTPFLKTQFGVVHLFSPNFKDVECENYDSVLDCKNLILANDDYENKKLNYSNLVQAYLGFVFNYKQSQFGTFYEYAKNKNHDSVSSSRGAFFEYKKWKFNYNFITLKPLSFLSGLNSSDTCDRFLSCKSHLLSLKYKFSDTYTAQTVFEKYKANYETTNISEVNIMNNDLKVSAWYLKFRVFYHL